jgi:hypothetical protein
MVKIRRDLVSAAIRASRSYTYSGTSTRTSITFHETANPSAGATADAHARLQKGGNSRKASWHWQVDEIEAVQSFPHKSRCYHAGSLAKNSIAIEVCVNGDVRKAWDNAIELARQIRADEPVTTVKQHHAWTLKNCPALLRGGRVRGLTWSAVKARVMAPLGREDEGASRDGDRSPAPAKLTIDGKWGSATTRALQKALGAPYVDGVISRQNRAWKASNPGLTTGWEWFSLRRKYKAGSQTIARLQRKLGVTADGLIGPKTIKALQQKLGTTADGEVWNPSAMVKALQRNLNNGKVF